MPEWAVLFIAAIVVAALTALLAGHLPGQAGRFATIVGFCLAAVLAVLGFVQLL